MKINWASFKPVRDQAARLRGDYPAQNAEIEKLRAENERLQDLLREANEKLGENNFWNRIAAPIRGGGRG